LFSPVRLISIFSSFSPLLYHQAIAIA
jgi:hypothetical protein